MNLDQELRRALKRQDPPRGFDDRVLARIASGETVPNVTPRSPWNRMLLPVAASLLIVFGGSYYVQQQEQRQARAQQVLAARATQDVTLALQVAGEALSTVQIKVQEMNHEDQTQH